MHRWKGVNKKRCVCTHTHLDTQRQKKKLTKRHRLLKIASISFSLPYFPPGYVAASAARMKQQVCVSQSQVLYLWKSHSRCVCALATACSVSEPQVERRGWPPCLSVLLCVWVCVCDFMPSTQLTLCVYVCLMIIKQTG